MTYTFAIGDIHGCLDKLTWMLNKIERTRPDGGTVVFLGDYVDRGPDSAGVIDLLIKGPSNPKWNWICLKGNHEIMMIDAMTGRNVGLWLDNGGHETQKSYGHNIPDRHFQWIVPLRVYHHDEHRIFVHAGVDESLPMDKQPDNVLLWKRVPDDYSGEYWGKHLVHGHTPSSSNPRTVGNRTNVDSGAVFGGNLSCAVFHDETAGGPIEFIQV